MSKVNKETRPVLLQRVDHLEEWTVGTQVIIERLQSSTEYLLQTTNELRATLRSVEAQLADLSSCLAEHQMDTLGARIKRLWRR